MTPTVTPTLEPEATVRTRSTSAARSRPEDDADFVAFVHAETPALLRLARAMTGSHHDAWDLTQETLVRIGERWTRLDEPAAYARTVMSRLNIDRIRRLRREAPSWFTGHDAPGAGADAADAGWWLPEALAGLGARQRTALALRYVEDLDVAGIAARMGCSAGTVKSHLSRGTERLRAYAREHGHLDGAAGAATSDPTSDPTGSDR